MSDSRYMKKAHRILEKVSGRPLTVEERRAAAVELAALMLNEARRNETNKERKRQVQVARMLRDPKGKEFAISMTDRAFRSHSKTRVVDQLLYLLQKDGIPRFITVGKKCKLLLFRWLGARFPGIMVRSVKKFLRKETNTVIYPGERRPLRKHIKKRKKEGLRVNLNHLSEAIVGEKQAEERVRLYLKDLSRPEVEYISVKISSICSQISLFAWEETLSILIPRLKTLYRKANEYTFVRPDGKRVAKFVNLDMEAYDDLHLTVDLFRRVLDDPEFHYTSAGIVLQAYLPESYLIQQELTVWAKQRVANGGSPIKLRIVKGANLSLEKIESSQKGFPEAPYNTKPDVDANFKRMLNYGIEGENSSAVHIGVGSHNLFDIAYALLLRKERGVEAYVGIEMLEGMAPALGRVVHELAGDLLLYCPIASKKDFQHAIAYLMRRLDENSGEGNFLHHLFKLMPGTKHWQNQANLFSLSCHNAPTVSMNSHRIQNRNQPSLRPSPKGVFVNEPDTDWTLAHNRKWAKEILDSTATKTIEEVPTVDAEQAEQIVAVARSADSLPLLADVAQLLREKRGELIGAMVAETKKTVLEADTEVSEAIDFVEYALRDCEKWKAEPGIQWKAKGIVLVAPPWNFPCAIAVGGIAAALAAGNGVLFKPAPEARYVGWRLAEIFWAAGVSKEVLQYIACDDEVAQEVLVQSTKVTSMVLTGATKTAQQILKLRPGIDLYAETGGKNSLIVSAMADRDLAVEDIVQSAFGHAGQKCSACSLAILEKEVYQDRAFLEQLRDAAASLNVGSPFDPAVEVNPLIRRPSEELKKGLTVLEKGEYWLLKPEEDVNDPTLWSPGIKMGVKVGSFSHQTEFFGPLLSVMCADDIPHAIRIANDTDYGLTAGIHSLDDREQKLWMEEICAGNLYINRTITGAIVGRQSFGGCKASSFGRGAKTGGPNYVTQFMEVTETALPEEKELPEKALEPLTKTLKDGGFSKEQINLWRASIGSYAHAYKHYFHLEHELSSILGEENTLSYRPRELFYRVHADDDVLDTFRVIAASITCGAPLTVSGDAVSMAQLVHIDWPLITMIAESDLEFIQRISEEPPHLVRLLKEPSREVMNGLGEAGCSLLQGPVLAHGRLELLNCLREVVVSTKTHRYGYLVAPEKALAT